LQLLFYGVARRILSAYVACAVGGAGRGILQDSVVERQLHLQNGNFTLEQNGNFTLEQNGNFTLEEKSLASFAQSKAGKRVYSINTDYLAMEISFLGAAQEVGRSSILVSGSENVMLDCGLKIHAENTFPIQPEHNPDYVVLSHAHLDHSGFLPALYRHGEPELICTPPSLALGSIIIEDSMRIMAKRGEFPFRAAQVKRMKDNATVLSFKKRHEIGDSTVTLYSAGHIPGAAMIDIDTGEGRVVYSGDFKGEETKTTFASEPPPREPDALLIESTYADRDHPSRKELEIELGRMMEETLGEGGTVLFPAFAIGRTQELVRIVRSLDKSVDVFLEGMGLEVNETLSHFSAYVKDAKLLRHDLETCTPIRQKKDRDRALKRPSVIICTAGMLQGGPALHYLLNMNPESLAVFTGYNVEGTNGYNLVNNGFVEYDGIKIKPKSRHAYLDFSAHAGRRELFELVEKVNPKKVFCIHGDECPQFAEDLKVEGFDAYAPAMGEKVTIR